MPSLFAEPIGPLKTGVWIPICTGLGFYVPPEAYDQAKSEANKTGRTQFLTVTKDGQPVRGTRDECMEQGTGAVAWIMPEAQP